MARRFPASLRADAQNPPPLGRPARHASEAQNSKSELIGLVVVVSVTIVLSTLILWQMDIFGSGAWENTADSRVHLLHGEPKVFTDFIETKPDQKVVFAFYTKSCPHCKRMREPFMQASASFPDVTFVAIDASKSSQLADQYKVESVPRVLFMPIVRRTDRVTWYDGSAKLSELKKYIEKQIHDADIVIKAGLI